MLSEITLLEAINLSMAFSPVKIIYKENILYNDFDIEGMDDRHTGEILPPKLAILERLKKLRIENEIVSFVEIEIVEFHHSVIKFM